MPYSQDHSELALGTTPGAFPETERNLTSSSQQTIWQAVHARISEYTEQHPIRIKVGTWNVAALKDTEKDLAGWFVEGKGVASSSAGINASPAKGHIKNESWTAASGESVNAQEQRTTAGQPTIPKEDNGAIPDTTNVDLYVLGLQEVVDINSPTETFRPYVDHSVPERWKRALLEALPQGYKLVAEQQLTGLLLLIAGSPSLLPDISAVSTTTVGTGLMGYMGNKGATSARLVLGEATTLVFINCHLAAGTEKGSLERRNWDAGQIAQRTRFEPVRDEAGEAQKASEMLGSEDCAWWFGDLNYRLEGLVGDDVRRLLLLHARNEYDLGKGFEDKIQDKVSVASDHEDHKEELSLSSRSESSTEGTRNSEEPESRPSTSSGDQSVPDCADTPDPTSLETTLSSLLPHDQLRLQQAAKKAFHDGWREGPIKFLPTYKYDIGSVGMFDSSDKKRGPSWCDRVLFRTRHDKLKYEETVQEEKRREEDKELKMQGKGSSAPEDEHVLFDYNPETDGANSDTGNIMEDAGSATNKKEEASLENPNDLLQLEVYTSHQRILTSDHKPLVGLFTLTYKSVVPHLKRKIYQEVALEFDKAENAGRPGVTLVIDHNNDNEDKVLKGSEGSNGSESMSFGKVYYSRSKFRSFTVANTSRVTTTFQFVNAVSGKLESGVLPTWLRLRYSDQRRNGTSEPDIWMTLEPGEALNFALELRVDDIDLVRSLNEGRAKLEHVLILRVVDGRDHFIPVEAEWMQTCFGRSLEELSRMPKGGVRQLQKPSPAKPGYSDEQPRQSAPREVLRLIETVQDLVEEVVGQPEIHESDRDLRALLERELGWPFTPPLSTPTDPHLRSTLKSYVHEALDTDTPPATLLPRETLALARLDIVAEVLLDFLASLKDGIITEALWTELEQGMLNHAKAKKTLTADEELLWIFDVLSASPVHNVSFVFLTSMLARVAELVAPISSPTSASASALDPASSHASQPSDSAIARRRLVGREYARIFAGVVFRGALPSRDRDRRAAEERRRHIIEVFLREKWER